MLTRLLTAAAAAAAALALPGIAAADPPPVPNINAMPPVNPQDFAAMDGAWYSFADQRIGQGRENAKNFLKENPDIAWAIEDKIRAAHGLDFAMSGEETSEVLDD